MQKDNEDPTVAASRSPWASEMQEKFQVNEIDRLNRESEFMDKLHDLD